MPPFSLFFPMLAMVLLTFAVAVVLFRARLRAVREGLTPVSYFRLLQGAQEPEFLAEYNAGRRLHELESALASADSRIAGNYRAQESIKQELTDIGVRMIASDTTVEQRLAMVTRSAELGRRYGELTTEIQQLERDRAVAERALLDYRATLAAAF